VALLITGDCINCEVCLFECGNEAIARGAEIHVIDGAKCTECVGIADKPRCVTVCAVDCIIPDPDRPYLAISSSALFH
jgi:ferredoxin